MLAVSFVRPSIFCRRLGTDRKHRAQALLQCAVQRAVHTPHSPTNSPYDGKSVVLFSWFGAREKDVNKYADYWRGKGATCLVLRPNIAQSMVPGLSKSFAEEATTEIRRLKGPFIVHCFSNGGFFMLSSVLQFAHHSSDKREKDLFGPLVDKIIFDSCPSVPMRPDTVASALITVLTGTLQHTEGHPLYQAFLTLSKAFLKFPMIRDELDAVQHLWSRGIAPVTPQLFLFSDADQALRGCNHQIMRRWKESLHVQHFKQDPTGYHKSIESFVMSPDTL